ncbi:hypothetical protein [Azospirillum sp.]|uniref:hypothetical protein n=1 Tax=Azospirillum sp. TaxID=34012 RepID=UPI002D561ACE|nr:hypothetical protein [Azospirillum sp.]HYD69927.1 hypothetical protein [Azospirillum sp.]
MIRTAPEGAVRIILSINAYRAFILNALAAALCLAKGESYRIDLSGFTGGAQLEAIKRRRYDTATASHSGGVLLQRLRLGGIG